MVTTHGYYSKKTSDREFYEIMANRPKKKNAFSQYRGVTKNTGLKPYRVQFKYKGVNHYLGSFDDEIEAAKAYNNAVLTIIGPFAVLNEIPEEAS